MNKRFYFLFILPTLFIWGNNNITLAQESKINLSHLKRQAERGNARAQNELGDYYDSITEFPHNKGCFPYNRVQTIKYYTKAARQGYFKAQKSLGMLYSEIPCSDYDKGIYWLRKVAWKNDVDAQLRLADVYHMRSPEDEWEKATFWYKKAAHLKNTTAMYLLGKLYERYQEYDEAIYWYKKAMKLGSSYSSYALCDLYFIPQGMPKEEIERYKKEGKPKDNKISDQYCLIAVKQGSAEAQFLVGARYMTGRRVPKDEKKAMEYFKKSCQQKYNSRCKAYQGKLNFNDATY